MKIALILLFVFSPIISYAQGGLVNWPPINLGPNLVVNGDFETGDKTGWSDSRNAFAIVTDEFHSGTFSIKATNLGEVPFTNSILQNFTVSAGEFYRLSFWIKTEDISGGSNSGIRGDFNTPGANGKCQGGGGTTPIVQGTNDWFQVIVDNLGFNIDCSLKLRIGEFAAPVTGTVWLDDIVLERELPPAIQAKLIQPSYRGYVWSDIAQEAVFEVTNNDGGVIESVVTLKSDPGNPIINQEIIDCNGKITIPITEDSIVAFRIQGQVTPIYPQYQIVIKNAIERQVWPISWTDDNRFRVNDEKKFLLWVYDSGIGYSSSVDGFNNNLDNNRRLNEIDQDLTGYLNYHFGKTPAPNIEFLMDALNSREMNHYWQTGNCFGSSLD